MATRLADGIEKEESPIRHNGIRPIEWFPRSPVEDSPGPGNVCSAGSRFDCAALNIVPHSLIPVNPLSTQP